MAPQNKRLNMVGEGGKGDGGRDEQRDGVMVCRREEGIISHLLSFAMVAKLINLI